MSRFFYSKLFCFYLTFPFVCSGESFGKKSFLSNFFSFFVIAQNAGRSFRRKFFSEKLEFSKVWILTKLFFLFLLQHLLALNKILTFKSQNILIGVVFNVSLFKIILTKKQFLNSSCCKIFPKIGTFFLLSHWYMVVTFLQPYILYFSLFSKLWIKCKWCLFQLLS